MAPLKVGSTAGKAKTTRSGSLRVWLSPGLALSGIEFFAGAGSRQILAGVH